MPDIMGDMDIAFPNLGIYLENVPKSFSIFGFTVAIYGLIIGIGVLLAVILISHIAKITDQNPDDYWDLAPWLVVLSVIGARVYYVVFAWDMYKDNLISVFYIRNGGLAIYGGILTGIVVMFVYTRIKKMSFLKVADTVVYGVVLGQIMGRWGNFANREAFGEYTNNLFAMRLPQAAVRANEITDLMKANIVEGTNYIQVTPTFLYESMWNICVLVVMLLYLKHKKFNGEIFLLYLFGYGVGRFWIESLRTDQLIAPILNVPVSMIVAATFVIVAVVFDILGRKRAKSSAAAETHAVEDSGEEQ